MRNKNQKPRSNTYFLFAIQRSVTPSKADHEHILGSPSRDHSRMGVHDDDDLGLEDDMDDQLHGSYMGNDEMGESKLEHYITSMHYITNFSNLT